MLLHRLRTKLEIRQGERANETVSVDTVSDMFACKNAIDILSCFYVSIDVSAVYVHDRRSLYWYTRGYNLRAVGSFAVSIALTFREWQCGARPALGKTRSPS